MSVIRYHNKIEYLVRRSLINKGYKNIQNFCEINEIDMDRLRKFVRGERLLEENVLDKVCELLELPVEEILEDVEVIVKYRVINNEPFIIEINPDEVEEKRAKRRQYNTEWQRRKRARLKEEKRKK